MFHSFAQQIQVPCPQCGQPIDLQVWLIVDLAERPDLGDRIRGGTLHDAPCPHCGHAVHADAPLLVHDAGRERVLFSPAQETSVEQDQDTARALMARLAEMFPDPRPEYVSQAQGVPRELLPAVLDGGDLQEILEAMQAQAAEEMERLRREDPEAYAQLEQAARQLADAEIQMPAEVEGDPAARALAERLIAWIEQETLDDAEAYLREHEAELLAGEAAAAMEQLVRANPLNSAVRDHQGRLARAREMGISAMYAGIRRQRQQEGIEKALQQLGPIGAAVARWVQADDDQAAALLQAEPALLLTLDTGNIVRQLAEAAAAAGDEALGAHLQARLAQWQAAHSARVPGPLRQAPDQTQEQPDVQPERWAEQVERQPVQDERGSKYTVIHASHCAIGDNAVVINQVGRLPLRWKRPAAEGCPRLTRLAVGREPDLDELHRRLRVEQSAAVVGRGTSAAVRGLPAVGKTTLAAMYVDRYGDQYAGGVLWLNVGPNQRGAAGAFPILRHIATYAYDADLQAQTLLANSMFAADAVRALLDGHGALLAVIDDVWDTAVLRELQAALPADACILMTTRDYDVAYSLENSAAAIQPLDVLSVTDARLLLQKGAPGLSDELADRVGAGLGRHALALTLAAGALSRRGADTYPQTAAELLRRVAAGQGFGDLPRMDKAERQTDVEIACKYSYDELGQGTRGAEQQSWFRALGSFAQEADLDAAAAATVWDLEREGAHEFLLWLEGLSLIQRSGMAGRWQQHALLRAYALSLQAADERTYFPERHADYYTGLVETCYDCKPRDYERVEQEFAQVQHAFVWCTENSPRRVVRLALPLNDFMRNRGRVGLLGDWLQTALHGAELYGDRLGKANTLKSLGDLESRLGNVEQARRHYDAALPLYEAEQDPFGKMNTWISLAQLEAALGHVSEADRHYQRTFALAEQVHFADHPVVRGWRQEHTLLGQAATLSSDEMPQSQVLAGQLIGWIQTPDWAQSEAYLLEHAAALLVDEAEAMLETLQQGNPGHEAIPEHQALLRRCREIGIEAAYREFHAARAGVQLAEQDPAAQAIVALLQVDSMESLEQTLAQHPLLLELDTLERLAGLVTAAAGQPDAARRLLALLAVLMERYNHAHPEQVDLEEQGRFVALHEALLPTAEALAAELAAGLRDSLGWALNTLGNTYAGQDDHAAAIEAYARAIDHAPENAMLYRNRAGEYIELQQWAQAAADVERAAALEPDAPRLAELRAALADHVF